MKGSIRFSSPVFLSIALLSCFQFSSVLWSIKPTQTLFKLTVVFAMAMAAFGVASRFKLREFLTIVSVICVAYIFIGVAAEIAHGYLEITSDYRFIGTTHPNTEAIYASLLCIIARLFFTKLGNTNLWGASTFMLGLIAVWFTKSRTTLAGMILSLMITQILVVRGTNRLLLITFGLLATSLGIIGSSFLSQRSTGSLGTLLTMGRKDDVSSLSGRLPLWEELLTSINKAPILGHGYLGYWDHKRVEYLSATFRWEIPHGHNLYLDTLLDGGVVGLFLLIIVILTALYEAARLYSQKNQIEYAIVFGLFAYGLANGMAESLFKLPSFPLFVLLACCFAMVIVQDEESLSEPTSDGAIPTPARQPGG